MATETMNYGYPKPGEDDFYDISQFNQALDMIAEDMKGMDGEKQNKLGIGTFKESIDILGEGGLPQANSVCLCRAKALRGTLPYESQEDYWFTLETNTASENQDSSERSQRAVAYGGGNIRIFERLFMDGGWKGWKEILRTDGDTKDNVVTFQSEDTENPTGWADISPIESGEKHSSLWRKFSLGIKNLRYLRKLLGTTDISKVADGTVTGAISVLNTGIVPGYISSAQKVVELQGWYRIARAKSFDQYPPNSCVVSIKRHFNSISPEYQKVQFLSAYTKCKFVSLSAISYSHTWAKIRETHDEINDIYYIEIYQSCNGRSNWIVSLEDALCTLGNSYNWQAIEPVLTQETASGITVLTSLVLPGDNPD